MGEPRGRAPSCAGRRGTTAAAAAAAAARPDGRTAFLRASRAAGVGFLSSLRAQWAAAKRERAAKINGGRLKGLLRTFKEERDRIEAETGRRPPIDDTTRMFMQKVLDAWAAEGRRIDEDVFWDEVDHNRQFDHPVEYYEARPGSSPGRRPPGGEGGR